ncbi:TPA: hypothetical protein DIV49_01570, partial [Candidatus Saccharibacteria bacterium]|nr:hypothetical protein [Candidatus Saccharibacteria bacterium]
LTCPEQYRLYYVENLRPKVPAASLRFGQCVHLALAAHFQEGENAVTFFESAWAEIKDFELRYSYRESWQSLNDKGKILLEKFLSEELPKLGSIVASEKAFELSISNLEVPFVGVIDLIADLDGKRTVVDFKTSGSAYDEFEVELSDQLTSYQLAEPDVQQCALCVLVKTKEPRIEWHLSSRTGEQMHEFLAKAEIVGQDIASGRFYKRPGKHCAWCDYQNLCLRKPDAYETLKAVA